jgi:hypothetical protein
MMENDNTLIVPTEEETEQEFLRQLILYLSLSLKERAERIVEHAEMHKEVSRTIIDSVINGKQHIAIIWDARTQGTHGMPCAQLVFRRYRQIGEVGPKDPSGKLPSVLTAEELRNANIAAEEFSAWLEQHKPVDARTAVQAFREIGQRHQSQDGQFEFIFTLDHAKACLKFLIEVGKINQ